MILQLFIGTQLVDQAILSHYGMADEQDRESYLKGAMNELLEPWEDLIIEHNLQPQFFIKASLGEVHTNGSAFSPTSATSS